MSTAAVDHVFSIMAATYGAAWDRSLGNAPITDVKTVWSDTLEDFLHSDGAKRSILWALKNLPDTVLNSRQFRTLCRQAPMVEAPLLPEPKADPARIAAEVAKIRSSIKPALGYDFKDWARRLIANPERCTPTSLQMARDALGVS